MKTRDRIIAEHLQMHKRDCEKSEAGDSYKSLAQERGQEYVDRLVAECQSYSTVIRAELRKRLTEETYLVCEDFDHFDVNCCDTCHTCYPHYEMWVVVLSDGRHAWVCDNIKDILLRQTKRIPTSPEVEAALRLLDEIFGVSDPDPFGDALHEASMAANCDEEKLYYCIKYAHHIHKRKRGHKTVGALVYRALRLPGRGPARRAISA